MCASTPDFQLPALPAFPVVSRDMAGPTAWCNWVVKDHVLAGAFPGSVSDEETDRNLLRLLRLGKLLSRSCKSENVQHSPSVGRMMHANLDRVSYSFWGYVAYVLTMLRFWRKLVFI
jgi:hypothetical protein